MEIKSEDLKEKEKKYGNKVTSGHVAITRMSLCQQILRFDLYYMK